MELFKFVDCRDVVVDMAEGNLKFTPVDQLNDPTEMWPTMDYEAVRSSLEKLRQDGLTEEQFKWLHHQNAILDMFAPEQKIVPVVPETVEEVNRMLQQSAYQNLDYLKDKVFGVIEAIKSNVGILSLSECYDSLPMWAHYAKRARGFAVAFKDISNHFAGDETGSLNVVKRVEYMREIVGMTFDPTTQDRLFFSKHSDWEYERERRVVTALNTCNKVSAKDIYLRKIDPTPVTSVICGWKVSKDERQKLRDALAQLDPSITIKSAIIRDGKVVLEQ